MTDPAAVLVVDNTVNANYFALSPHGLTWLWDVNSLAYMQQVGLLTGDGLDGAQVLPWETIQHYIEMAWTGGDRVPTGYTR
ncbi:MAG TPA: hypothetical protein VIX41_08825 [Acidimicrobiales bacterium]